MSDRPHWSYSSINQYLRCPLQYFFQRVLGLPSRSISSGLVLGSAVHAGLAEYHRQLKELEDIDNEGVLKTFHECWSEKESRETVNYKVGDSREDGIEQGVHLLELYLQQPPPEGIVAIEQRILVPLYNSHGEYLETPLVAIADLITGHEERLTVKEFKTSGRAYSSTDVESSLQPTCYVHAVRQTFGVEANVEYTVLVKTKTPKVQRIKTARYAEDCGRLGDLVQTIQRAVDFNVFYPVENAMNCSTCPYRQPCREWGHGSKPQSELVQLEIPQEAALCSLN